LDQLIDKSNLFIILGDYEEHPLTIRKGKYGLYATWGEKTKNLSCFGNRPMENISFEDVKEILDKEYTGSGFNVEGGQRTNIIRQVNNNISIRSGKFGPYGFYKTQKMNKPMFLKIGGFKDDYKTCHVDILENWFKEEYGLN
jgi:DNA topoisomerase-1